MGVWRVPPSRAHLTIDLELDSEPISGALQRPGGSLTPFQGWIQLVSLLQDAATTSPAARSPNSHPPIDGASLSQEAL